MDKIFFIKKDWYIKNDVLIMGIIYVFFFFYKIIFYVVYKNIEGEICEIECWNIQFKNKINVKIMKRK